MSSLRRHDRLAIALLLILPTLYFGDVLIGVNDFYMRDLTRYYYPAKQILRDIVLNGEFPYWNRYFSGGQPIAANPEHEVFYPFTWLILLPSYNLGFRLHILIHIYIGLLGMYALLRSMDLRPLPALFGAVSFGLGGVYLSDVNLLPILFCAAWLPLTCLFVRRFLLQHRPRDFALGALFLGLQFLVAEPTTVIQTGLLVGFYGLYRGWYSPRRIVSMLVNEIWIALISIAAFLVGCAQMLPALDHVADSARSRPFDFSLVEAWSMPWAKFAEIIYPNILGHIAIKNVMWYYGGGLYTGMGSPFLFSIYCGLAVTALAIAGAFTRPRSAWFLLVIIAVSVLFALGGHTPLLKWLYEAHIATAIRYPEKFILMAMFATILFASQTLQRALDGDVGVRDTAAGFALATTLVAGGIAAISFTPLYQNAFMKVWGMGAGGSANYMTQISRIDWIVATGRGALLTAVLLTMYTKRRAIWLSAALAFLCADLGVVMWELNPRMPRRFFDPPPVAATLRPSHPSYRVFHEADWYGQDEIARKYFSTGDAVYWIVRNGLFPMTPAGSKVRTVLERDYDKTALLPTIDLVDSVWDVKRSGREDWYEPFMAMSNAWYRGVYREFEDEKKRAGGNMKDALPISFLEGKHYPRYYFADQIVQIKNRGDFVDKLSKGSYSDRVAFISGAPFVPADGVVRSLLETSNDASLEVESGGRGFLVMSVTPHKYWRITLDGRPIPPIVTNIGYQGVVVPSGRHRIEMHYRNTLAQRAMAVSGVTIFFLLLLVLVPGRAVVESVRDRDRPQEAPPS
ncbi:MAG TPA: hypothetical protein VLV78_00590 [Thermoanaerobaculia bacterium]|nr:hypothetical protein [Thermoanaerobaculia bacterium]